MRLDPFLDLSLDLPALHRRQTGALGVTPAAEPVVPTATLQAPAQVPAEAPAEASAEAPTEAPAEDSAEAPVDVPTAAVDPQASATPAVVSPVAAAPAAAAPAAVASASGGGCAGNAASGSEEEARAPGAGGGVAAARGCCARPQAPKAVRPPAGVWGAAAEQEAIRTLVARIVARALAPALADEDAAPVADDTFPTVEIELKRVSKKKPHALGL